MKGEMHSDSALDEDLRQEFLEVVDLQAQQTF